MMYMYEHVASKSNKQKTWGKKQIFCCRLTKIAGSGARSGSGSVSQRYGSADPNPYQNVTDRIAKLAAGRLGEYGLFR